MAAFCLLMCISYMGKNIYYTLYQCIAPFVQVYNYTYSISLIKQLGYKVTTQRSSKILLDVVKNESVVEPR